MYTAIEIFSWFFWMFLAGLAVGFTGGMLFEYINESGRKLKEKTKKNKQEAEPIHKN